MKYRLDGKVNALPVPTFRHMRVNGTPVSAETVLAEETACLPESLPEGVRLVMGGKEAEEAKALASAIETGLGPDFGEGLEKAGVPLQVLIAEAKVTEPVRLRLRTEGTSAACDQVIRVRENCDLTLFQTFEGTEDEAMQGIRTRVIAEKGSHVKLVRVNLLGKKTDRFDAVGIEAANDASVELVRLELGGRHVYAGSRAALSGYRAAYADDTAYFARDDMVMDLNLVAAHYGKKTKSRMDGKGVASDRAVKTYRYTIDFQEGCAGAEGAETEEALLLSPEVVNRTAPLILCHEEDVEGSHGASIGKLEEGSMFYLNSRGMDQTAAKELMTRARIRTVAEKIGDRELEEAVSRFIGEVFGSEE